MRPDLDKAIQRTKQYWYEDGMTELGTAIVFALVAAVFALEALSPEESILSTSSAFLLPVAVMGGIFVTRRLVTWGKDQITYPRSGYVSYKQPSRRIRSIAAAVATAIAVGVALIVVGGSVREASARYIPLFTAVIVGGFFLYVGASVGALRFYLLGVASVVFGAGSVRVFADPTKGSAVYFAAMSAALVVSGAATLYRYLRANDQLHDATAASEAK